MTRVSEHIDFRNGTFGCAVSVVFMVFFGLVVAMTLPLWKDVLPVSAQNVVPFLAWLFAMFLGGYAAAWKGATNSTSALAVGLMAETYLILRFIGSQRTDSLTFSDRISELIGNPQTNWYAIALFTFTVPAAMSGGMLWRRTSRRLVDDIGQ